MKKKITWQSLLPILLVLIVTLGSIYIFMLLNEKERNAETDLYSLVPRDCYVIVETSNAGELITSLEKAGYAERLADLHISKLLESFKSNLKSISEQKAHGFSKQMNRIMISFHQPNNEKSQVLYCQLGNGDEDFVEAYIRENTQVQFPPKRFKYRGEEIIIYPLNATEFLACYYQPEFLAISFEERLIERVIDTNLDGNSILDDSYFTSILKRNKMHMEATIYQKGKQLEIGEDAPETDVQRITHWMEMNIKFNPDAIYLSGISFDPDTCQSLHNALKRQDPTEVTPPKLIPSNTYLLTQASISDPHPMFATISGHTHLMNQIPDTSQHNDSCFYQFLQEQAGASLSILMFGDTDKTDRQHAVALMQLKDPNTAPATLKRHIAAMNFTPTQAAGLHIKGKYYPVLAMPELPILNSFAQKRTGYFFTCFYEGNLLMATERNDLKEYLTAMAEKRTKENEPLTEECYARISEESNMLLIARMDKLETKPVLYRRVMPTFFYKHMNFFKHFLLVVQFTESDELIYPTLILRYLDN